MIYIISLWLSFIIGRAIIDYTLINKNKIISHEENATVTCVVAALLSIVDKRVMMFPVLLCTYWILFDIFLNWLRGLPLQYLGRGAVTDKFLRKYAKGNVILFKTVLLVIFVTIYKLNNL